MAASETSRFDHVGVKRSTRRDGAQVVKATGYALNNWACRPWHEWPCSALARLDYLEATLAANGDLVDLVAINLDADSPAEIDVPGDELSAFLDDALAGAPAS